jgi:hypothetical protein
MSTFSGLKLVLLTVLLIFIVPLCTYAEDYKWLKTAKYENVFVIADLKDCEIVAKQLNETIKVILTRSGLRPSISDNLFFQSNAEEGKSIIEFMNNKLIENNKIFFYVYGQCIEYKDAYVYQFDINFALFDNRTSQAILYSVPKHSVIGVDKINGMKKAFNKLIEGAVSDYLSANKTK